MNVTLLLCDHAEVADGKLFINGGGWDTTSSPTAPFSVAILLWVPWDRTNAALQFRLALFDEDGEPVRQQAPDGTVVPVELAGDFEVGRPPGATQGAALPVPMSFNFGPMGLDAGRRFHWQVWLDGETDEAWTYAFATRPNAPAPTAGGPADFQLP
jgi:hypothetical protein